MSRREPAPADERGARPGNRVATAPASVLVIDDNPSTRDTFKYMLTAEGYAARTAPTVQAGLAAAAQEVPDAILLDLHMPVTGGVECLRELRASPRWAQIPVAVVTGDYFIDEAVATELGELGARVYFKPVWEQDLRHIVSELLGGLTARTPS